MSAKDEREILLWFMKKIDDELEFLDNISLVDFVLLLSEADTEAEGIMEELIRERTQALDRCLSAAVLAAVLWYPDSDKRANPTALNSPCRVTASDEPHGEVLVTVEALWSEPFTFRASTDEMFEKAVGAVLELYGMDEESTPAFLTGGLERKLRGIAPATVLGHTSRSALFDIAGVIVEQASLIGTGADRWKTFLNVLRERKRERYANGKPGRR